MKALIPSAALLREQFGGYTGADAFVAKLMQHGRRALDLEGIQGDRKRMLARFLEEAGLVDAQGGPCRSKLAELIVLMDLLAAVPEPARPKPTDPPLLFTLPATAEGVVEIGDRIERRVNDLIARTRSSLVIGGPFWNEGGLRLMTPVLEPALQRGVAVIFYAHPQGPDRDVVLQTFVDGCRSQGDVNLLWWRGGSPSLMHAKFVVADAEAGYLGTANHTSLGMEEHLEIGVPLGSSQAARLVEVLRVLTDKELFGP